METEDEEMVEVAGRRLPLRVWEAEVIVRAAGWVVIAQAVFLLLVLVAILSSARDPVARLSSSIAVPLLFSPLLLVVGLGILRRSMRARKAMVFGLFVWIVGAFRFLGAMGSAGGSMAVGRMSVADLLSIPVAVFPPLYLVFALLGPAGHGAFDPESAHVPLAPLLSVTAVRHSMRGWAACLAVWITLASLALAGVAMVG